MTTRAQARLRHGLGGALRLTLVASPVVFAVPVLFGIGHSLGDLLGTAHPYFRDASGVNFDGLAIRRGIALYQDPAAGYTPNTYTPLMPLLAAGADLVWVWSGWTLLVTIGSTICLLGAAAWLAYAPSGRRRLERVAALAGAIGMGAIALWMVAFVPFNFLFSSRPDHLCWALGLIGLVILPLYVRGSTPAGVAALALLSLSFWAKQTGLVAPAAGTAWLIYCAARGRLSWRRALVPAIALAAVNGALWLLLAALTDGWSVVFISDYPSQRGKAIGFGTSLERLAKDVAAAALLAAILWLPVLWLWARERESPMTPRAAATGPLVLLLVVSVPLAARFGQAGGSVDNQYVGVSWTLGLIAAAGFAVAQRRRTTAIVAAAAVVSLFVVTEIAAVRDRLAEQRIFVAGKSPRAQVTPEPTALRTLGARRSVYHPVYSDVNPTLYPSDYNISGLYISGEPAKYLVRAFLARRFDVVYAFQDRGPSNGFQADRMEDNWTWTLNEIIRRKYRPVRVSPALDAARTVPLDFGFYESPGVYGRAPGPDPAPWLSTCIGPFRLSHATWNIRVGGGLWCRLPRRGQRLRLVATPALASEVRSRGQGTPSGEVGISVGGAGAWAELSPANGRPGWTLRATRRDGGGPAVTLDVPGTSRQEAPAPGWPVRVRLVAGPRARLERRGAALVAQVPSDRRHLILRGSVTSGADFDLADLRLG